jgi:hypothetical protein
MSPELNRSDDRGKELATAEKAAEPATSPEAVQHQPADDSGQLTDDSGRSPAESHQAVGGSDRAVGQSGALAATRAATEPAATEPAAGPEPGQAADREPDAAGAPAVAKLEPAADQTDGALLADAAGLRAGWQRIQGGFVDDPGEAVADAADLVEHVSQAFVGALQQRQRWLRGTWNGDGRPDGAAEPITDTEQLRLVMQRYRSLFDQLCRP